MVFLSLFGFKLIARMCSQWMQCQYRMSEAMNVFRVFGVWCSSCCLQALLCWGLPFLSRMHLFCRWFHFALQLFLNPFWILISDWGVGLPQISKLRFETSKLDIPCERCRWPWWTCRNHSLLLTLLIVDCWSLYFDFMKETSRKQQHYWALMNGTWNRTKYLILLILAKEHVFQARSI